MNLIELNFCYLGGFIIYYLIFRWSMKCKKEKKKKRDSAIFKETHGKP